MDTRSLNMYKEALRGGKEKVYNIRVMIVGQYGVGKTMLTKRLLGKDVNISERKSTEGIDVHIECSKVALSSGEWTAQEKKLIEVWLNSILFCAPYPEAGIPPVILVGTHVDKISQKMLPSKVMALETKTITSETAEFPTTSAPTATDIKEHLKPSTVLGSVQKLFKLQKTIGMVESTPASSSSGAHALPVKNQLKKERKLKPWPWKKKKKVGTDEMAASSAVNPFGGKMVVVGAGTLQAVMSAVESVGENILDADAQEAIRHEICERYFSEIRTYLSDKPTRFHLVNEDFAIDNTIIDSKLGDLKRKIVEVASQQSYWGEEIPTRWIPLEQELMRLKAAGVKLITQSILENLNQAGAVPIATEELDLFLRFHHEIGTILYFSTEALKDKVVLDPQWMIDALKSLITAEMFVLRSAPAVADKWFVFKKSGTLSPELIDAIWTKTENPDFHDNKEHILLLMEKLNIIARPRSYGEDGKIKEEKYYLAPCMLRQATPKEIISPVSSPQMESTSVISFMCVGKFLPPPVFHRLIGACLTKWPIAKQESDNLIYCGCCVFDLDLHHRLTVYLRSYVIFAQVTRMKVTGMSLSSELCIEAKNFIFENLSKIIENVGQSMEFQLHIQCPSSDANNLQSLIAVSLLQKNEKVPCHSHKTSHILESKDLLKFWFEESQETDEGNTASAVLMPPPPTGDTDRFMRLTYLLVDVGSRVLRQLLSHHTVTPTCTLDQYLAKSRSTINGLLKRKVLHQSQMDILFPPKGGNTNIEDYDVTLLSALFNNIIPSLSQQEKDKIKCMREDRNKLYGHAKSCKMNAMEYQTCWNSISLTLIILSQHCGDPNFENEISREIQQIQVSAIPTGSYLDILKTWFSTLETVKGSLETAEGEIQALKSRVEALESKKTAEESEGK